ncbi:DUF7344 domain-containing protein [Natrinema gelatinilyticum]|uniref:DUF7344 domain-containing protein n=1 Tax=Natrinema gelatinilyticum TaxID=2961571 RepID=UPI0020C4C9F9|nr:hypothetical protein [Natrinema gelatinilyticum]
MTQSKRDFTWQQTELDERSEDTRYRLLEAERRRMTLDILAGVTATVELTELAAGIVAREDGVDAVTDDAISDVTIVLHHVHLPMMDELGIIDYDASNQRIESCPSRADVQDTS